MRLSYHRNSHFDSIIDIKNYEPDNELEKEELGVIEDRAIALLKIKLNKGDIEMSDPSNDEEEKGGVMREMDNLIKSDPNVIKRYRSIVETSRSEYEQTGLRDLEQALEESLRIYNDKKEDKDVDEEEKQIIDKSKKEFEQQMAEDEMLKIALEESLQNNPIAQVSNEFDENMLNSIMQSSMLDQQREQLKDNPIVREAEAMGFSQNDAIEAILKFGNDQETVLNYLLGSFQ